MDNDELDRFGLLPDESWHGLRFLDTGRIHAEAVVVRLLGDDDLR